MSVVGCTPTPITESSRIQQNFSTGDLNKWINGELTDYLAENLGNTPKFRNEPTLIVSMKNEQISSDINGLTADIRSQLMDNLLTQQNVRMVRRQSDYQNLHHRSLSNVSCDKDAKIRYYLGFEIDKSTVSGDYTIRVRVMESDKPDQWVSGISTKWSGKLNKNQVAALSTNEKDPYLQGLRDRPFGEGESDLLAQYLAHNMSCLLAEQNISEIKLFTAPVGASNLELRTAINMVDNYLSRFQEVRQSEKAETSNAILKYEFFEIDRKTNLSMLNVSINFKSSGERVQGVDTQAYITLKSKQSHRPQTPRDRRQSSVNLISDFSFVVPSRMSDCDQNNPWYNGEKALSSANLRHGDCFALEYRSSGGANHIVYENTQGELSLMDKKCLSQDYSRGATRIPAIQGEPSAIYLDNSRGNESFYLLSFKSQPNSSRLLDQIEQLPSICGGNGRSIDRRRLLELVNEYSNENPGDLDWKKIVINHR